jgi:hypothetical protein
MAEEMGKMKKNIKVLGLMFWRGNEVLREWWLGGVI